jgi:hypothetical protein
MMRAALDCSKATTTPEARLSRQRNNTRKMRRWNKKSSERSGAHLFAVRHFTRITSTNIASEEITLTSQRCMVNCVAGGGRRHANK